MSKVFISKIIALKGNTVSCCYHIRFHFHASVIELFARGTGASHESVIRTDYAPGNFVRVGFFFS